MQEQAILTLFNLLKPVQQEMFRSFYSYRDGLKYVIHCSRRLGKTYFLCVLAIVVAITKANANIRYASVTQKSVRKMIHPIMKGLFSKLPKEFKGLWNTQEGAYIFPNGSMIHVAGVNNGHSDDLRGTEADLCIVDEGAFIDELEYLVESVLVPQLITTGGKLVMASSSPLSPAHQFASYIHLAKEGGFYSSYDIDQGGYPTKVVDLFIKEAGGRNSTTARREYFNELIVDDEMALVPEWNESFIQEVKPDEFRPFYHNYAAMDLGVKDKTAIIWAYYDFKKAQLIVEADWTKSGSDVTTRNIASAINEIEKELKYEKVYKRISDNDLLLLNNLSSEYNLYFSSTGKGTLASMMNDIRLMIQDGRIIVHPRCTQLIGCLKYGVYQDSKRDEFGRSKAYGHYDAFAALVYLVRNLDQHTNPIPPNYGYAQNTWNPNYNQDSKETQMIKKIFNIKK